MTNDLIRWDAPFAKALDPSVGLITELVGKRETVVLVVAPMGSDLYPKYLVRFRQVVALLLSDEAVALDRGYPDLSGKDQNCCAYLWEGSPWLEAHRKMATLFDWTDLQHYLVFGGDSIVELIANGRPEVEQVDQKQVMTTKTEI